MERLTFISNGSSVDLYSVVPCSVTLMLTMTLASTSYYNLHSHVQQVHVPSLIEFSIICDMKTLQSSAAFIIKANYTELNVQYDLQCRVFSLMYMYRV